MSKTEENKNNTAAKMTKGEWVKPRLDVIPLNDAMSGGASATVDGAGSYS